MLSFRRQQPALITAPRTRRRGLFSESGSIGMGIGLADCRGFPREAKHQPCSLSGPHGACGFPRPRFRPFLTIQRHHQWRFSGHRGCTERPLATTGLARQVSRFSPAAIHGCKYRHRSASCSVRVGEGNFPGTVSCEVPAELRASPTRLPKWTNGH
jgi:hypothetical protein